ncbi:MAG: zf-HC2 domain-containing protein [Planctomycetota bacterium]
MTCPEYKDLMMGYLDNELEEQQKRNFEKHLAGCEGCQQELKEFRQLKELTESVGMAEPEEQVWRQYWGGVYNRIERGLGWILLSIGAVLLIIYGGFKAIEEMIKDPAVGIVLKIGLLVVIAGLAILFVSVLRECLYFRKKDRYKDVRR